MKKIIATVLAMVMALALCTTAFAAEQKYDVYDAETGASVQEDVSLTYVKKDADNNTVAHYTLSKLVADTSEGAAEGATVNYFAGKTYVSCKAADADYVLKKADTKNTYIYLVESEVEYDYEGKAYTNLGTACGQFDNTDEDDYAKKDKFFTYTASKTTYLVVVGEDWDDDVALLVEGGLVAGEVVGELDDVVVQHAWVADVEKMTAACSNCKATAKLYETYGEVPSGADYETINGLFLVADASNTTPSTDKNTSPKTFDAGIAMYVGMALTSVAGSAVVIGKKKEF